MGRDHGISIYPVLMVNFIGTLGYSILLPFLIFLVEDFGGNGVIYGLLASTYPALQLIGAPLLGRWSDYYGRRKILLLSQAGTLLAWAIFIAAVFLPVEPIFESEATGILGAFAITVPLLLLFFARALDGLTGGNVSVANAYLADITPDDERNKNFGKMAISSNLGFVVGPALAGVLGATALGHALPAIAAFVISLIAVLVIAFYLPESHRCALGPAEQLNVRETFGMEQKDCYAKAKEDAPPLKDALKQKNIPFILVLYFLIFLGFNFFYTAFPVHAVTTMSWNVTQTGAFYAVLSILMVLVQGPVLSFCASKMKFSDITLVIGGGVILGTNFIFLTQHSNVAIYAAVVLFALGNGLMWPSFMALLSKAAGDYQGTVQGFASSCGSAASIVGLIAGGFLYDVIGSKVFMLCAIIIYGVTALSLKLIGIGKADPQGTLSEDPESEKA
jgi:MFS family permease